MLAKSLLSRLEPGRKIALSDEAMAALMHHDFPGNVRELRNILERALIMVDGNTILPQHLSLDALKLSQAAPSAAPPGDEIIPWKTWKTRYLAWAAEHFQGDRRTLAQRLGISERTLYRKLREAESYRP